MVDLLDHSVSTRIALHRKEITYHAGYGLVCGGPLLSLRKEAVLHPEEIAYFNDLKYDRRKHSYLLGRASAKIALSSLSKQPLNSILIDKGVFDFPIVRSVAYQNTQVSISHCDDIGVALAFPEHHPMAVDIERIKTDTGGAIRQQLTPHEIALAANCSLATAQGHTLLWTVKESLSKVLRTGLMIDPKALQIEASIKDGLVWRSTFTHCGQYRAVSQIYENYVMSIVLPERTLMSDEAIYSSATAKFFAIVHQQ